MAEKSSRSEPVTAQAVKRRVASSAGQLGTQVSLPRKHFVYSPLVRRIVLIFASVLLPVFLCFILLYRQAKSALETHILDLKEKSVVWLDEELEKSLDSLYAVQSEILTDRLVNIIYNTYTHTQRFDYQQGRDILSLQTKLLSVAGRSSIVADMYLLYPDLDLEIAPLSLNRPIPASRRAAAEASGSERGGLVEVDGRCYALLSERVGNKDLYLLAAELSQAEIALRLDTLRASEEDIVILSDAEGNEIARSGDPERRVTESAFEERDEAAYTLVRSDGRRLIRLEARQPKGRFRLVHLLPEQLVFQELSTSTRYFIAYALFLLYLTGLLCFLIIRLIRTPLNRLQSAMESVELGDFEVRLDEARRDEFAYVFQQFNIMVRSIQYLIEHTYEKEILLQKAELKQLQAQIAPHFLFNIYFTMHRMIRSEDYENALACSQYIGKYYQYIARSPHERVSLEEDWEHARNYLALQELRFADRLEAAMEVAPPEYRGMRVPKLLLQPLLENTFEHAVAAEGPIVLRLHFAVQGGMLVIAVEDNGKALSDDDLRSIETRLEAKVPVGALANIKRRLSLQEQGGGTLGIGRSVLGGLKVEIHLAADLAPAQGLSVRKGRAVEALPAENAPSLGQILPANEE